LDYKEREEHMELYQGLCKDFINQSTQNNISTILSNEFAKYYGYRPSYNEVISWQNSLKELGDLLKSVDFFEQGIKLEYFIPLSSLRIDVLLTGINSHKDEQAVLIELKQWQTSYPSLMENEVKTAIGGGLKDILHPSVQVDSYKNYLQGFLEVFYQKVGNIKLDSCVFLHNYIFEKNDPILDGKFNNFLISSPIYSRNDRDILSDYLKEKLGHGSGKDILEKINKSNIRPSKKLLDEANKIIKNDNTYVLIEEQRIVFDHVLAIIKNGLQNKQKQVLIINGGPGTGKSLIAINLLAELSKINKWAEYVTGSAAFTQSYKKAIGNGASSLFKYTNSYVNIQNQIRDCLIIDEAHRIREKAPFGSWMSKIYSGKLQIEEIIDACNIAVFFIDDDQVVLPDEVGNSSYIREHAERLGCNVWEEELKVQFRCAGNDGFIKWVENTFEIRETANVMLKPSDSFEFKIFDSPLTIEDELRKKIDQGYSARMVSGFSFPWSKEVGALDVSIGDYQRPWNLRKAVDGNPASNLWAYSEKGFGQVGCVYSAQGFEFDYIGVIIGNDITYDFNKQTWLSMKTNHKGNMISQLKLNGMSDTKYQSIVKNIYRVLLSRGMKGCFVYFMDKNTENFIKTRIKR
jgi:DUF2075 family protein